MRRERAIPVAFAIAALVLGAAGCTQVAQLRGVAGGDINAVRTATNDVLVQKGVPIRTAPVCAVEGATNYGCQGTAADGAAITSTAVVLPESSPTAAGWATPPPAHVSLIVTVAGRTIYTGTVEDVLQRSGQVSP